MQGILVTKQTPLHLLNRLMICCLQSYQLTQLVLPTGHFIQHCKPKGISAPHGCIFVMYTTFITRFTTHACIMSAGVQSYARRNLGLPTNNSTGTLAAVGSPDFSQYLMDRIHHPAHRQEYGRRERVPSASSQRARRGFKYWNAAKPPTPGELA